MNERIKVGDGYLELPSARPAFEQLKAEKPEIPEPLEELPYIYRPNDPFQSAVDEARAIASIGPSQKSWVKRAWFVLFVYGPLFYLEVHALILSLSMDEGRRLVNFLLVNLVILPAWFLYRSICKRRIEG